MKKYIVFVVLLLAGSVFGDTKKIEGTTNIDDAQIIDNAPDLKLGDAVTTGLREITQDHRIVIRVKNVATELGAGATITNAVCSVFCEVFAGNQTISAYSIFKPWIENDVTYNDWVNPASEWTTAGCDCAGDGGSDNSQDGGTCDDSGRDRKATAESATAYTGAGWVTIDISNALAQSWYDGTKNEEGIILIHTAGNANQNTFTSAESSNTEKPFFVFTFTVAGGGVTLEKVTLEKVTF